LGCALYIRCALYIEKYGTLTSQFCGDATYLVQKRSANSLQLLKDVSAFVAEEFLERKTINTSLNQRRTYQCEITYKNADKRNDFRNIQDEELL
jgi:hypothetical protein